MNGYTKHQEGDRHGFCGEEGTVERVLNIQDVDYELWSLAPSGNGAVRVTDTDSGEVVGIVKYKNMNDAGKVYEKMIEDALI